MSLAGRRARFNWQYGRFSLLPPPLAGDAARARLLAELLAIGSIAWFGFFNGSAWPGVIVPLLVLATIPLLFLRWWPAWDLLAWMDQLKTATPDTDVGPDHERLVEAQVALAGRNTSAARERLRGPTLPTPWLRGLAAALTAVADLIDGQRPDSADLDAAIAELEEGPRKLSLQARRALVAAGIEDLDGRDWRAPILACRETLHLSLSPWRAIYPIRSALRDAVVLLVILVLLPYGGLAQLLRFVGLGT